MLEKFVILVIIAFISFFGLHFAAQLVDMGMGNNPIDDEFHAIIVVGTVVICCTYIIISKINALLKSLNTDSNDDSQS